MRLIIYTILINIVISLSIVQTYGYESNIYNYEKLTTINNLAHNDVQDIMQDSCGFIWIATNGGLSRYDGYDFVNYMAGERGLGSILILDLCEDRHHNIWITTADKGLYYYHRHSNQFHHISTMCDSEEIANIDVARCIREDDDGNVWFYDRLSRSIVKITMSIEEMQIISFSLYEVSQTTSSYVNSIVSIEGDIYAGTYGGLLRYSKEKDQFELVDNLSLATHNISYHNGILYFITSNQLFSYDLTTKQKQLIGDFPNVSKMCWSEDTLYIATTKGVYYITYDPKSNSFSNIEIIDEYKNYTVSDMILLRTGELYVSFIKEAIRVYSKNYKPFQLIDRFGNNHITPICVGEDNSLWVGTDGDGYYIYKDFHDPDSLIGPFLNGGITSSITYSDYYSKYFIATESGLYSQDNPTSKIEKIETVGTSKQLCADGKYIWVSSYSMGLTRLNLEDGSKVIFTPQNSSLKSDIVRCVIVDREGMLWIATDQGLFTIDKDDKHSDSPILHPFMLEYSSSHYIIPLYEDQQGGIWYGTLGAGLHHITRDERGYRVERYDTENLLPSDIVNSITEDNDGNIWVSHSRAISKIDVEGQKVATYDIDNGIQNYGFYDLSTAHTNDNILMFGGVSGVTAFDPNQIKSCTTQGELRLVDFKVFNKSILRDDNIANITELPLEITSSLSLSHDQNSFSLKFSGFNYTNTKKQRYSYKLSGFDRDWIDVESNHQEVSYTNIPHGRYTFSLRTANCDNEWNPKELHIDIIVAPPFWLTWYAYVIYVLIISLIIYCIMIYYKRALERENAVKFARMEKDKVQELLDARIQFITNVSHEFRTPLTLILSPLQKIMADPKAMENNIWRDSFKTMLYNGETLLRLVNEFLSFQKRDSKHLKLNLRYEQFDLFVENLSSHMRYLAQTKEVTLEYLRPNNPIYLGYDAEHVEQIVYNLLSNAIKHTSSGDVVTISFIDREDRVELIVRDTGEGIPQEAQSKIFDRFVSLDSAIGGIGIGLSLTKNLVDLHNGTISFVSVEGEGTTFNVTFPKEQGAPILKNDDIEAPQPTIEPTIVEPLDDDLQERRVMLIVDDNEQILKLLQSLFVDKFRVLTAKNGIEGYNLAQSYIPDFIISDVMMPLMDGLEFCDQIKESTNTSHIPIILLTAKSSIDDMAEGYRHHADGYCVKPFDNIVLIELVNSILNNRLMVAQKVKGRENIHVIYEDEMEGDNMIEQDRQLLKRITAYIEANIGNSDLKVSDICGEVGLRQVILNKKLRSLLDMTAVSLIRTIRLKRAAELLRTGRYTVASITYDTGFADLRHFRNSFKKEYGVFPQAYKNQYKSTPQKEEEE